MSDCVIEIAAGRWHEHLSYLSDRVSKAAARLDSPLADVSIALVDDATMSDLHVRFMNIAGPTDVLTFELDHDAAGRVTSGEVVLCVDEAARQAAEQGHTVAEELLLYAVHGLLHLCGYDDRTDADFARMHAKEDELLEEIGVGRLFRKRP